MYGMRIKYIQWGKESHLKMSILAEIDQENNPQSIIQMMICR